MKTKNYRKFIQEMREKSKAIELIKNQFIGVEELLTWSTQCGMTDMSDLFERQQKEILDSLSKEVESFSELLKEAKLYF